MTDQERAKVECILDDMRNSGSLPVLAQNVADIGRVASTADTGAADLAAVIMRDAGISASLITLANSAAYAQGEPVRTISRAIVVLGFEKVQTLALGLSVLNQFSGTPRNQALTRLYASSYFTGAFSHTLARQAQTPRAEEIFVAGLLYQLPRLALANTYPERFRHMEELRLRDGKSANEACQMVFGISGGILCEAIAELYGLPQSIRDVLLHTGTRAGPGPCRGDLVHAADALTAMMFSEQPTAKTAVDALSHRLGEILKQKDFSLVQLIRKTCGEDKNITRFFHFNTDDADMVVRMLEWGKVSPAEIMAKCMQGAAPGAVASAAEPENLFALWAQYLGELSLARRRERNINSVLMVAQEAFYRCLRPVAVVIAFHDVKRENLLGRFYAGQVSRVRAADFAVSLRQASSPLVQALAREGVSEWDGSGPGLHLPGAFAQPLRLTRAVFMPIMVFDRAIGLCFLGRAKDEPVFTAEDKASLEELTSLISQSFELLHSRK